MPVVEDFLQELKRLGMLHDATEGLSKALASKRIKAAYVGFDPTAPSLHVGNLVTLMLLVYAHRAGIRPVILLGGATGLIGDPAGKIVERSLLERDIVSDNVRQLKEQLSAVWKAPDDYLVLDNYDWFKDISLLSFLRDVGKHFPVGYMLGKETTRSRLEQGLSFTEFSYQLIQAYDFYHLRKKYNVQLQMGGADQWGNITSGVTFTRRVSGESVYGLTTPLLTRDDGSKFGKSEGKNIWLSAKLTSPYAFYQFWYNQEDSACEALTYIFVGGLKKEIEALISSAKTAPHKRILQQRLAREVTSWVHGPDICARIEAATQLLFGGGCPMEAPVAAFTLLAKELPYARVPRMFLASLQALLCDALDGLIVTSRAELRRLIKGGGLSINGHVLRPEEEAYSGKLAHGRYLLVKRGKKHFYLLEVVE